jgi:hypothetical protein
MKTRTTLLQIIQVAWLLYRNPNRKYLRIGQMILNSMAERDYYYVENPSMIKALKQTNVLHQRR